MDTAPNTKGETIRISSQIKNKIKMGDEEGYQKINRETKNMKGQYLLLGNILLWPDWFDFVKWNNERFWIC